MPAARAASSREAPCSTSARASIRRAARASRHRAASRRRSPAPGSRRVIAIVIRALPCRRPTTDQPRRAPQGSGRDNTSGIQAVGIIARGNGSVSETSRDSVFISYSHADAGWREKIEKKLLTMVSADRLLWSDTRIETGDKWHDKIDEAVNKCKVAFLLLSD